MKRLNIRLLLILIFFISVLFPTYGQSTSDKASEAYRKADFKKSIELYEQVVSQALSENKESAEIYYNLGNAYFRDGQLAKSILNYERALIISPNDKDIKQNLRFVRLSTEDKINTSDSLLLSVWIKNIQNIFNSDMWAKLSIILFILFLVSLAAYLFVRRMYIKKSAFYLALVLLMFTVISNVFAFTQKNERQIRNKGIVMSASINVMSSPDSNSKELFRLHSGTKVIVTKVDGNWYEVEISNGAVGWTSKENVEII